MLTLRTQKAIALMQDIASRRGGSARETYRITPGEMEELLACLRTKGLILPGQPDGEKSANPADGYRLARPLREIFLLDVLEALDEHLNCNRPTTEEFYFHYNRVAPKLGVVNHMTRLYLEEIKLSEC
ncbi:hypothetical protein [Bacteroides oleiciplenus]|uniref:Uncharacterized protein n=1 Tax=Bacteroides oleiciplenus TaxID=626931 RepID=A0A3E5B0J3_9BACE|nr:hypothetical protein [Bacteroides oleiciplenus]RGN30985.1 hypothetical protein DXB65_21955 [Bacteroides oleiciplenus]